MRHRHDRPMLLGHRGVPDRAPENTLDSFRAALDAGLDGVELDVHVTRDGVLAVHHDPVTSAGLALAEADWPDLRTAHPDMPRLEEVFEVFEDWYDGYLNVELKGFSPGEGGSVPVLADALTAWRHPAAERTWVSCFDPHALVALERAGTSVPLALLAWNEQGLDAAADVPGLAVSGIHADHRLCSRERIQGWHAAGRFVFAWTVNSADAARTLTAYGIDGLIGDHPERLKAATP